MPGFDGTGPTGQGPRTGRGLGNCTPQPNTPRRSPILGSLGQRLGLGRGLGRGRGRGAGRGRR